MLAVALAPAKLNLALELTGKRPDGYHLLAAVSQTIRWSDVLAVASAEGPPAGPPPRLAVRGPQGQDVPEGEDNILMRAARLLQERGLGSGIEAMALCKRIPTQSGLGGGSADAAALISLAAGPDPSPERDEVALLCGADVPFALCGGAARMTGVGEILEPLPSLVPTLILVAVLAHIPTAAAYAAVRPEDFSDGSRTAALGRALEAGSRPPAELMGSGLLPAALRVRPALAERLERLRAAAPELSWAMTGSGGAFFTLLHHPGRAAEVLASCRRACPEVAVRAVIPA